MANGNAILSGLACLAERGKYAEIARENEQLKATLTETGRKRKGTGRLQTGRG